VKKPIIRVFNVEYVQKTILALISIFNLPKHVKQGKNKVKFNAVLPKFKIDFGKKK